MATARGFIASGYSADQIDLEQSVVATGADFDIVGKAERALEGQPEIP